MSPELPVSIMIQLTRTFAIHAEITKASSWSGYSSFLDPKVILGSWSRFDLFSTVNRAEATTGLGQALAKKFNSNSFVSWSNDEIEDGLSQLYHIRARPLDVVGKAWYISVLEVS
ncbi:hypothetical protein GW17_00047190 [Ensete ventricosum]|nr:hypothetical protein GW17_00047190 [Ensete ventricosum]